MNSIVIPALGILCAVLGLFSLIGCFARVNSPAFIERTNGDERKIAKLHSLQDAWDKLGKSRQFIASASGYLIMAAGLLLIWYDASLARYYWIVPALYVVNLAAVLWVRTYARIVLDKESVGHAEVLRAINLQVRICISFSVVYVILASSV